VKESGRLWVNSNLFLFHFSNIIQLQKIHGIIIKLQGISGWTWSDEHGCGIMEDSESSWEAYLARNPEAKPFKNKGWVHFCKLDDLIPNAKVRCTNVYRALDGTTGTGSEGSGSREEGGETGNEGSDRRETGHEAAAEGETQPSLTMDIGETNCASPAPSGSPPSGDDFGPENRAGDEVSFRFHTCFFNWTYLSRFEKSLGHQPPKSAPPCWSYLHRNLLQSTFACQKVQRPCKV